ncbi:AAA family ATPase [Pseudomonas sp. HR96]|uniref:AAA family ATPase n=1 Tax=Pseudomonas sp. HR96 TaxID=1027966 RepID=UPI002A74EE6E|nr:AAA family ATPase [Pseudomonas sp. HR96]WPO98616.1 AAA family ATPase [Pseudomonas sp. HR96]
MRREQEVESVYVDNFKSLVEFDLRVAEFTCLVGFNGAGKSTILQLFDFIASLFQGAPDRWLSARGWKAADLTFKPGRKQSITFQVKFRIGREYYFWLARFNRTKMACTFENISRYSDEDPVTIFHANERSYRLDDGEPRSVDFNFLGTVFSQIRPEVLGPELLAIRNFISGFRSLDLLAPNLLRERSRAGELPDIGLGGEKLSAFLHGLSSEQRQSIVLDLRRYYPQLIGIHTSSVAGGWIKIEIEESIGNGESLKTEARHINDGFMRLLAISAQRFSVNSFLLYDEIENGVNSEVTQMLVDALIESPKQSLVTTHSPVVLNFLTDELARQAIVFVYKRADGVTRAIRLFDVPSASRKLDSLSPGEAMIDIPQSVIAEEAEEILRLRRERSE